MHKHIVLTRPWDVLVTGGGLTRQGAGDMIKVLKFFFFFEFEFLNS